MNGALDLTRGAFLPRGDLGTCTPHETLRPDANGTITAPRHRHPSSAHTRLCSAHPDADVGPRRRRFATFANPCSSELRAGPHCPLPTPTDQQSSMWKVTFALCQYAGGERNWWWEKHSAGWARTGPAANLPTSTHGPLKRCRVLPRRWEAEAAQRWPAHRKRSP